MINTTEFTKRLQKIIDYYDETASSFATKIGVQRSSISHILSGRNKPSLDFVMKVLHSYPEVDLYWLMNGTGNFPSVKKEQPKTEVNPTSISDSNSQPKLFSESYPEPKTEFPPMSDSKEIDKIIIFYKDGSFKSYQN